MQALHATGGLYVIDMTFFDRFPAATVDGFPRFTPATMTFLRREAGAIVPFAIRVTGQGGGGMQHFVRSDPNWLYALQAAKTSDHGVGDLARSRLPLAHRHRRDADDHVPDLRVAAHRAAAARPAIELPDRVRPVPPARSGRSRRRPR